MAPCNLLFETLPIYNFYLLIDVVCNCILHPRAIYCILRLGKKIHFLVKNH